MALPLQTLLLMLTQKKLLEGGWQIEVPTLFKSFLFSLSLIPRLFLFFSLSLSLSYLALLSFVQRPCEFSKLNAIYNVTPLHFDTFSSKMQARILQIFTSISLHFTFKPPTEYIFNTRSLRIKADNYHFSSECQKFTEMWSGNFVSARKQKIQTKRKQNILTQTLLFYKIGKLHYMFKI